MNIDLSPIDRRKVKNLGEVLEMNNEVLGLMSRYLTVCPDFITKELIEGITGECEITLAEAYTSLLVAACGLDVENNPPGSLSVDSLSEVRYPPARSAGISDESLLPANSDS